MLVPSICVQVQWEVLFFHIFHQSRNKNITNNQKIKQEIYKEEHERENKEDKYTRTVLGYASNTFTTPFAMPSQMGSER